MIKRNVHSLLRINNILDTLEGTKFFSTLDLALGYWQIGMDAETSAKSALALALGYWQIGIDAETSAKSAFTTYRGLPKFTRMPFDMCNPPATFQLLVEVV